MVAKRGVFQDTDRDWIVRWADAVRLSADWQRFLIALLSGVFSVLALAPFFFWPVLFVTLPHLVWLTDGVNDTFSRRQQFASAALNGWLFGFGYFSAGLFWVGEAFLAQSTEFVWLLPFAVTLFPAGLALFFALALGVARLFWSVGFARVLTLAIMLAGVEWLRGHVFTGFPWNLLGYAFTSPLPLMQMVSVIGVYGLTVWVVILSALPAVVAVDAQRAGRGVFRAAVGLIISAAALLGMWIYGTLRLEASPLSFVPDVKMRIVQLSLPQREKWVPENRERIFADHLKLSGLNSKGIPDNLSGVTHVIWPEVALPFFPLESADVMKRIGAMLPKETFLLTGALRRELAPAVSDSSNKNTASNNKPLVRAFNSLLVFNSQGQPVLIYDKIHLVPFGEYLPFQKTLETIGFRQLSRRRGGFSSGPKPRPLLTIGMLKNVVGLICYEAIFPGGVSAGRQPKDRASLYVNITNDAWFGDTTGPRQHFHQARARAVETGIPILRAANNGISAMIGPAGRVEQLLPLNHRGTLDLRVPQHMIKTFYARWGNWTLLAQLVTLLLLLGIAGCHHIQRNDSKFFLDCRLP